MQVLVGDGGDVEEVGVVPEVFLREGGREEGREGGREGGTVSNS